MLKLIKYIRKSEFRVLVTVLIMLLILAGIIVCLYWQELTKTMWITGDTCPENPYAVSLMGIPIWMMILGGTAGFMGLLFLCWLCLRRN